MCVCIHRNSRGALHTTGAHSAPPFHQSMFNPLAKRPGRGEGGPGGRAASETIPSRDERTKGAVESFK